MAGRGVLRTLEGHGLAFHCPGCGNSHAYYVQGASYPHIWQWNGDYDRPTFTPSLLINSVRWVPPVTPENYREWERAPWKQEKVDWVCHLYVTEGKIHFLPDCSHELRGQTVHMRREDDMQENEGAQAPEEKKPENPAEKIAEQADKAAAAHGGAAASDSVAGTDHAGSAGTAPAADEHAIDEQHEDTRPHDGATLASTSHPESEEPTGPFIVELASPSQLKAMTDAGIVFERFAPEGVVQPSANDSLTSAALEEAEYQSPLHGSAAGKLIDEARAHLADFERHIAADAHHLATEAYDFFRDKVDELRGHFHRRTEP